MQQIEIPTNCPVCDSKLLLIKDQLFCKNVSCEAQVYKKIEHFAKTLSIKGLGPATIAKLGFSCITEIYLVSQDWLAEEVGEKTAVKLMQEIEYSKNAEFATVLSAMSIPLIGGTAAAKLSEFVNDFDSINAQICKDAGLGEKATNNLQEWIYYDYPQIKEFLPFKFERKVKQPITGKVVCITGKLSSFKTKKEAATALNAKGFQVSESLTKTVDFLVDEENKSSTKRKQADKYGISIITDLQQFLMKDSKND